MTRLDIQLKAGAQHAVVVGHAHPAGARVMQLLDAGFDVTVIAPSLPDAIPSEAAPRVTWCRRAFEHGDVAGASLVFVASDDAETVRLVREASRRHGALFNDARTGEGDFSLPDEPAPIPTEDPWRYAQACLVGAGPGDPGLLTLHAWRALRGAEVVLYDRLVADDILALAPASAERIYVGKQRDRHHFRQEEINARMIELARAGRRVLRLKGGDPFVFGRGGEELTELAEAGISCRVIPGITAGSGCATYADIPLTHRDHAQSCQFITAFGKDGESEHDWATLVRSQHTLVVYMGVAALRHLCPKLIDHGMPADTPAALIERGTTPDQRVITGTVESLPEYALGQSLQSPAVLIIGDVVRVHERLHAGASAAPDTPITAAVEN